MNDNVVIFHLAKYFPSRTMKPSDMAHPETLYEQIRKGKKTSEWRPFSHHWQQRLLLCYDLEALSERPINCTRDLKVHIAWFVQGYPKGNMPRLEAEITGLIYHPVGQQFEIQFKLTREIGGS